MTTPKKYNQDPVSFNEFTKKEDDINPRVFNPPSAQIEKLKKEGKWIWTK